MTKKRNSLANNTVNKAFREKKRFEVIRKWFVRVLGLMIIVLCLVLAYGAIKVFRFASDPIREFQPFHQQYNTELTQTDQVYVGIWYETETGKPKRNAVAVVSPSNAAVSFFTLPESVSAKDPFELRTVTALPIDRYVVLPYQTTKGASLQEFVMNLSKMWVQDYQGISSYTALPGIVERLGGFVYTNASPRETSWIARIVQSVGVEAITFQSWPENSYDVEQIRLHYLSDSDVSKGIRRVWVRNVTTVPGLATAVSNILFNLGYEIVRVDSAECVTSDLCKTTRVLVDQMHTEEYSVKRVKSILNGAIESSTIEELKRADIIVEVGEDSAYLVKE